MLLIQGLVRPANGFVTEGKRTKHAEFGYLVTEFISSDARHIMTVHQTGVSVRFVWWKVLNMLKFQSRRNGHHRTSPDRGRIHQIRNEHKTDMNGKNGFLSVTRPLPWRDQSFKYI